MQKKYSLVVFCDSRKKDEHKNKLRRLGLIWDKDAFYGCVSYWQYKKIESYCYANTLKVKFDTGYSKRASNYRSMFFKYHQPQIGQYYICSYCGKLLTQGKVVVDHLYPIKKAGMDSRIQKKLRQRGIHDINDPQNLVASCFKCNARKAAKTGKWIFRGQIGQSVPLWIIRKILRVCLIAASIYALHKMGIFDQLITTFSSYKAVMPST